jgi:hypothetical protein
MKRGGKKEKEPTAVFFEDALDIRLYKGGRLLKQEADGFIAERFRLGEGTRCHVDIHVRVAEGVQMLAFMVGGTKNLDLMNTVNFGDRRTVDPGRHYKLRIEVKPTNPPPDSDRPAGIPHTEYPSNAMRFVEHRNGKLIFYSASLVSQHGQFFLIIQEQYDVRCFDAAGVVRCPYFEGQNHEWPQLLAALPEIFSIFGVTLPPYKGEVAEADYTFPKLEAGTAGVEYWDAANGIGGLMLANGERARVHWEQVTRPSGRRVYLAAGEIVRVGELITPVLTKERATKYRLEARCVTVIDEGDARAA